MTASPSWIERRRRSVARGVATYADVVVDHAHGAEVWDVEGRRYIDFAGGIGTVNVGHTPPEVVETLTRQAERLIHMCFSVAYYPAYIELAERLCAITPGSFAKKALLLNSGAEAVENAVKIARAATGRRAIISFENGFHGRTHMAMSLTGKERPYKAGFGPFAPDVHHARYPDAYRTPEAGGEAVDVVSGADLERVFATRVSPDAVAAIVVEPVQGEGGFVVAPGAWLRRLRQICDSYGILLIADEVQTGFGRTGNMFAVEHAGVQPDLVVMAKSLAAGMPLSAVVGRAEVMDAPGPGGVGGTFSGNPLSCAAALAVLDIFEKDDLPARARHIGSVIHDRFVDMQRRYGIIGDVRGIGAMQAIELVTDRESKEPAAEQVSAVIHDCHANGLIIIKAGLYDNVIRILAPLIIDDQLLNEGLDILDDALSRI
ncbi:MAG TPA: 4-aminobutyrate--2-oxoglutarate transaminase [Chloroflexota bacterium]|nr:4-aminobutyrate--2-oxoglutarate transaminase [Chloroflexota bacterium]